MIRIGKTLLILLTLQLVLSPERAQARVAMGQLQISPMVGIALPLGTLRDLHRPGYTAGLSLDYMVSERVAFGADLNGTHFTGFSQTQVQTWSGWGIPDTVRYTYGCSLAHYGLHLRWYLTAPQYPNPFLEFGMGAVTNYSTRVERHSRGRFREEEASVGLGFHFGAGLDLRISKLASGLVSVTHFVFEDPGGSNVRRFWTARFALAFQFRPI